MTATGTPHRNGTRRSWSSRVALTAVVHSEEPDVLRPLVEPTSAVTLHVTRVDDIGAGGAVSAGAPELLVDAADVPLGLADVDELIARLTAARGRMLAATTDLSARPGHRADDESP